MTKTGRHGKTQLYLCRDLGQTVLNDFINFQLSRIFFTRFIQPAQPSIRV